MTQTQILVVGFVEYPRKAVTESCSPEERGSLQIQRQAPSWLTAQRIQSRGVEVAFVPLISKMLV